MAVVATLTKGYDLDYIWRQVDRTATKDAAGYYIQASESGGEPPGRWWGPGAKALGLEHSQVVERGPYDLLFGERKAPDGTQLGRPPGSGQNAAGIYTRLLAAEPHATAERKHERGPKPPARRGKARCTSTLPCHCRNRSRSSTPPSARTPAWPARPATRQETPTGPAWSMKSTP